MTTSQGSKSRIRNFSERYCPFAYKRGNTDTWKCKLFVKTCGLQEERMDPPPDFGYDSYKGTGKLKNKVCKYTTV